MRRDRENQAEPARFERMTPIWTRSAYLHTGPRQLNSRTRETGHTTAPDRIGPAMPKKCLHPRRRPHTARRPGRRLYVGPVTGFDPKECEPGKGAASHAHHRPDRCAGHTPGGLLPTLCRLRQCRRRRKAGRLEREEEALRPARTEPRTRRTGSKAWNFRPPMTSHDIS